MASSLISVHGPPKLCSVIGIAPAIVLFGRRHWFDQRKRNGEHANVISTKKRSLNIHVYEVETAAIDAHFRIVEELLELNGKVVCTLIIDGACVGIDAEA